MIRRTALAGAFALGALVTLGASGAQANFVLATVEPTGEQKLYIDVANKNVDHFFGFVGDQGSSDTVRIDTVGNVDTGSGYANIKPEDSKTTLSALTLTPQNGLQAESIFFDFQANSAGTDFVTGSKKGNPTYGDATLWLSVNGGSTPGVDLFSYGDFGANANTGPIGIIATGTDSITSLAIWMTDADGKNQGFKEVKHIDISLKTVVTPDVVPQAVVPVPAALPIIGAALAGFGFAGWRTQRKAA